MSVKATTDAAFEQDVIQSNDLVLVDFWAEWCGPCKAVAPILDEVAQEMGDKVSIMKVNIDENPDSPVKYGVRSIPTLMLFKGGELLETQVGMLSKDDMKNWIERSA